MRVPSRKGRKVYSIYTNPIIFQKFKESCDTNNINYADCLEATIVELTEQIDDGSIKAEQYIEIRGVK